MDFGQFFQVQDKLGIPLAISLVVGAVFIVFLLLPFPFTRNNNSTTMHSSRIIRKVIGNPADPNSTRNLTRINCEEFEHIRLAVLSGQLEAATFSAMEDGQLLLFLESNRKACAKIGCEIPSLENLDYNGLREFFSERWESYAILIANMDSSRRRRIKGVSPTEFIHLVVSVQASCREAQLCIGLTETQIKEAFSLGSKIRIDLGLPFVHPYQRYEAGYHSFFREGSKSLRQSFGRSISRILEWNMKAISILNDSLALSPLVQIL